MALIKWSPLFFEPFEDFDKMFEGAGGLTAAGNIVPPVDIYETKDAIVVEMPLAGMDPERVDVSVENDVLTIKGSSERKTEVDEKDYYRREIRSGHVFRRILLPKRVKEGGVEAAFENGILKVTAPKREEPPKTIKVSVKKNK